jgi:protoheme IX farnesyltransferase
LHSVSRSFRIFLEIIKFKITILVSFTTGLGYILASNAISLSIFYPVIGIFLLACSASALNHYQERNTDGLMKRTSGRPIPSGKISARSVLMISFLIFVGGSAVLLYGTNLPTLGVGYLTFIWYNGVYTPLKKITPWAIIPGSLVGALPPLAGWVSAGGSFTDPRIMIVSLYFFIWQIPHFWLLLMLYSDDYKQGGFPTLTDVMNISQLKRITFIWLLATVLIAMIIPMFGLVNYSYSLLLLTVASLWMIYVSVRFLYSTGSRKPVIGSFIKINFYTLFLITVLSLDKLIKLL